MSPFRRLSIGLAGALVLPWLALVPTRARAADAPPAPEAAAAAETAPAPPAAIPAPEIVSRAESAKTLLGRIAEETGETPLEREIADALPETGRKLRERRTRVEPLLTAAATISALNDLDTEWRARARRLAEWRLALTKIAQRREGDRAELDEERALWERTRDAPDASALPPATRARVGETIDALANGQQRLQRQLASVLELQNEVAEQEAIVRGVVERVRKQRAEVNKLLWRRDSPPLWSAQAWAPSGDRAFLPAKLREAAELRRDLLREFLGLSLERVEFEGAVFALVLGALLAGRRRISAAAQKDTALAVPTRVFERPISAAIVVALVLAAWFLPRAPGVLAEAEAVVLLIPVLRLLPAELFSALRPGLIGLAALFLLGSVRSFFSAVPTAERLLVLPEMTGTIALLVWLQRPKRASRLRAIGRFGAAIVPVARVALVVAIAGALCNALGLVQLARVLQRGTLGSLYAAVAIYALARFASGVVTALVRSDAAQVLRAFRDHGELVRQRVITALQWFAAAAWLATALRIFGLEGLVRGALGAALAAKLEVGTVSLSLGNVVAFFLTLWLASQISRFVRFFLDEDVLPRLPLPRGVPAAISIGVHYTILAAGAFIAIGAAGVDLAKFSLLAGALGVGIGFGLQNVVNNFVSGLILLFERPVQTGDHIQVGELSGEVKRIGIRSSTVRTAEGAEVIVPNATLISDRVVNWTFSDRMRRVDLPVGVAYGSDPSKVLALLLETARQSSEVLSLPEPAAFFLGFGNSSLDFEVRVWCRIELAPQVRSDLATAIHGALRDAGIDIPFPQHDVHLTVERGGK